MYGDSFLLIKPDGNKKELKDEIVQRLFERNICILKQESIYLTELDIKNIWPYTQSDIVSKQLFMNYLLEKECILLFLKSTQKTLYKDVAEIKKKLRDKYGVHQYSSVIHTPGSYEEYKKDLSVFEKRKKEIVKNNTVIGSFKCYDLINKSDIVELCKQIENLLNKGYRKIIREHEYNATFLVVYKNGINDSYFMVGILGDFLKYPFDVCYYLAYSINYHTKFPILKIENSEYDIVKIREVFTKYNYKTAILKGRELL